MSDRCQQCGEVPNPDGRCACPRRDGASSFAAPSGSATSDVRLYREGNVWHVWIDGEHVAECCDFSFVTALDRLKTRLSPNKCSSTWRNRPPADLAANLCHWLHNHDRILAMTNAELVRECLGTEAADWDVVNEMMTRLHPGWENEPDAPKGEIIHKTKASDLPPMWEAYGPTRIPFMFDHESSVGPTEIHDVAGPLCVVSGDTPEDSLANAQRIADLLNHHGLKSPND